MAQAGDQGLVHRGRGQPSNRRIPDQVKAMLLKLYEKRSGEFGPTWAAETLTERQGFTLSDEPLRRWLRVRKAQVGALVQRDGSPHDGFEGRGPRGVLRAYIDEASHRVCARFYAYAGTIPALASVTRSGTRSGIPRAFHADTHTTDQSLAPPTGNEPGGRGQAHAPVWAGGAAL